VTGATIAPAAPDHRAAFGAATFGDVLRSEWTKLRSVRPASWALTVTVVLGIGLGAAISAAAAHGYARFSASARLSWDPTGVSLDGMAIATLAIAVLGVLCVSSEYSSGGQLTGVHHPAHTLAPWPGFGVMCLFAAIVYAIAATLLDRRDA
jgi:tetrahydromethanopterin S-methyltransferase subunit D